MCNADETGWMFRRKKQESVEFDDAEFVTYEDWNSWKGIDPVDAYRTCMYVCSDLELSEMQKNTTVDFAWMIRKMEID